MVPSALPPGASSVTTKRTSLATPNLQRRDARRSLHQSEAVCTKVKTSEPPSKHSAVLHTISGRQAMFVAGRGGNGANASWARSSAVIVRPPACRTPLQSCRWRPRHPRPVLTIGSLDPPPTLDRPWSRAPRRGGVGRIHGPSRKLTLVNGRTVRATRLRATAASKETLALPGEFKARLAPGRVSFRRLSTCYAGRC
jgi:hypothetical protein